MGVDRIADLPRIIEIFPLYAWRRGNFRPVLDYDEFFIHLKHIFLE
jgi:hypothetical protein